MLINIYIYEDQYRLLSMPAACIYIAAIDKNIVLKIWCQVFLVNISVHLKYSWQGTEENT